jgi:hypothetical protein
MKILLLLLGPLAAFAADAPAIRIELVTGGHAHEISFYAVFEGNRDFKINVNPHPGAFHSDMRKNTDVLVLYDMADADGETERGHLREFLDAGKGMVVLHHAVIDNQHWPWWYEEVIGGRYLLAAEGNRRASTYQHDVPMTVRAAGKHLPPRDSPNSPSWTGCTTSCGDRPVACCWRPTNRKAKAVAWIGPWEKSRVVVIQLGHGKEAHDANYRRLVQRDRMGGPDAALRPGDSMRRASM